MACGGGMQLRGQTLWRLHMYEHITKFIDDIEREGFEQAGPIGSGLEFQRVLGKL